MSTSASSEKQNPGPPAAASPQGGSIDIPSEGVLRRLLFRVGRRAEALWKTRVVEGLLLKRQLDKFYLIMGGHIFFQTLSAAAELHLFGLLKRHGRLTCAEIAAHLGIQEKPARILLLGCTALGLLRKRGATYANSRIAKELLLPEAPRNILSVIRWQHHINYRPMHAFCEAIKQNRNVGLEEYEGEESTLYERLAHDARLERIFQDAMEAISVQANKMLAKFVDFSDVRHLVDVGGGNGTNIIELARRWPHLRASVFDSPSVCEIARKNIQASGMADRLDAVPGDCFGDPFPEGADCLLFAHFFTIWSEETNRQILKKCHDSLRQGGRVLIFNMMQWDDETGPLSAAMGSPYFLTLATGEGMLYTWSEYQTWMRDAGFADVKKQVLPRDHGIVSGTKAR